MPIFLEKMILPALAAVLVAAGVTNPLGLSLPTRVLASVIVLAVGFWIASGLHRQNRGSVTPGGASPTPESQGTETPAGPLEYVEDHGLINCPRVATYLNDAVYSPTAYYAVPFSRPPNLTIELRGGGVCEWQTTEQRPDGFTIKVTSAHPDLSIGIGRGMDRHVVLAWTAKGLAPRHKRRTRSDRP
jgi:hypothetical protein